MTLTARWHYYRRLIPAYLGPSPSQLSFWHETPEINSKATNTELGPYYMSFREKAGYSGPHDAAGIPLLDYRGGIGLQYNPIAIAQWGLANYNLFAETGDQPRADKALKAADWLVANLERNPHGLWVWSHHFDWEYRQTLRAPWYSGLAQGQGISLLVRAHALTGDEKYREAADRAFLALTRPIAEGGVLFEDEQKNLWIEEYLVNPPTHILNGFMWALWGVFDFWLARERGKEAPVREVASPGARQIFDRGIQTLLHNLARYDTGYWSLYELSEQEQSGARLKMLASPFYHRLHIIQLRVMAILTNNPRFTEYADRWQRYAENGAKRTRALIEKSIFKLLYY